MSIDLNGTNASKVASALLKARRQAGSPSMGMVLTLVVVTDEGANYDAIKAAKAVSREHPSRILGVIRRSARGVANLDAEVRIGDGGAGETVLLRMSGELAKHPESVVLPLLLPDSPVVVWWPSKAPEDPASDPLGALAQRRITDAAALDRGRSAAMLTQAMNYAPGNTDLSWTRLTPWRALLAAALDQYPARITAAVVAAERLNPSGDLMAAWLADRLHVDVERESSHGPGITSVALMTGGGDIKIARPDGLLAAFSIPNAPNRPVALKRRDVAELLGEELRRLDPDDIYESTVKVLCRLADKGTAVKTTAKASAPNSSKDSGSPRKSAAGKSASDNSAAKKVSAKKVSAKKVSAKKVSAKKSAPKKQAARP